jgi:hypothetical protein
LLSCPPALTRLLGGAEGIDQILPEGAGLPAYDCRSSLMSLPFHLGTTMESIPADVPYLQAEPALAAVWLDRLAAYPGLKVGVVWRGSPTHKNNHNRSMTPEQFSDFLDLDGMTVVNLQKDAGADEIRALGITGPFLDAGPLLNDFADTAACLVNLDLVVTVDTSVCHLAGALGVPVWTLIPFAPDWRWLLKREDNPWYPTLRLFRQPAIGDWQSVVKQVDAALHELAGDTGSRNLKRLVR